MQKYLCHFAFLLFRLCGSQQKSVRVARVSLKILKSDFAQVSGLVIPYSATNPFLSN